MCHYDIDIESPSYFFMKGDLNMKLVGQAILHTKFGKGVVSEKTDHTITIIFQNEEKKFLFPDAFEHFLVLRNQEEQHEINELVNKLVQKRKSQENIKRNEKERSNRLLTLKVTPDSQAAFGFIKNTREQVFSTWSASTGFYLSGNLKGEPRIPKRMQLNSACLLTECPTGMPEKDRRIIGAFMVGDDFDGPLCEDGIVRSHEKYKIKLEDNETLLFWDYFAPDVPKWGNLEIRYFSNETMQKILNDIQMKISDLDRRQAAESFYQYFIRVNRLED